MPIIVLVLILLAIFLFFRYQNSQSLTNQDSSEQGAFDNTQQVMMDDSSLFSDVNIAYLAKGKLFSKTKDNQIEDIQSEYIQKLIDRTEKQQQQHGWKEGTSWGTTPVGGVRQFSADNIDIEFTSAEIIPDNKILYFLKGKGFGGLFRYDMESKQELRISHHQNLDYTDLNYNAERNKILCTSRHSSGVSSIVMMDENGDASRELTGGDTEDVSPYWLSDGDSQIVFQSMGLARSSEGYVMARGPASIQLLDTEKGEVSPVLENDNYDYLDPKVSKEGELFFIRRPYETPHYKTSNLLMDTLKFPFKLSRAIFHYLNFFSLMYTREPLTSASSPYVEADMKEIMLKGKRINAEEALKKGHNIQGVPSLVPKTWELVRRNKNGTEIILANSVSSYDLDDNGNLIYTNGCGVFSLENNNDSSLIFKDKLVAEVIL